MTLNHELIGTGISWGLAIGGGFAAAILVVAAVVFFVRFFV